MKFILVLIATLLFQPVMGQQWSQAKLTESSRLVRQAMNTASKRIVQKYCLRPFGTGVGSPGGPLREIGLSFRAVGPISKEDARRLTISMVNEVVQAVHETPNLENYLYSPPFTYKNVDVTIFFEDANGDDLYDPDIAVASSAYGSVGYDTNDPESDRHAYKQNIHETYEEALEAIKKEAQEYQHRQSTQGGSS